MSERSAEKDVRVERACEVMHDAYEAAAVGAGWETQQASRKPWADVPEANKATMRAAVAALIDHLNVGRLDAIETVLIENRRGTTNQMWLWDRVYDALTTPPGTRP